MARKSIAELYVQADATLPDNNTGLITPAAIRNMIKDFLDCMRPAYAALSITTPLVKAVTGVDSTFAWQTQQAATAPDWTVNLATGLLTKDQHSSMRVNFSIDVVAANNSIPTFTLYMDGVATPWAISNTSTSGTDVQSYAMSTIVYSGAATPTLQIRARSTANGNITLSNGILVAENVPVNSFI